MAHDPFRNLVYDASGRFDHSYDLSKEDESFRLAYVGVSRGKRRTHWFVVDGRGRFASKAYGSEGPSKYDSHSATTRRGGHQSNRARNEARC